MNRAIKFKLKNGKIVSELSSDEKNHLSHRYKASIKLKKKLVHQKNSH